MSPLTRRSMRAIRLPSTSFTWPGSYGSIILYSLAIMRIHLSVDAHVVILDAIRVHPRKICEFYCVLAFSFRIFFFLFFFFLSITDRKPEKSATRAGARADGALGDAGFSRDTSPS